MYALVLIDPISGAKQAIQIEKRLQELENLSMPSGGGKKILPYAWLLDLNTNLSTLRELLNHADDSKLQVCISFLEKEPIFST
jgi:hypothetical protein